MIQQTDFDLSLISLTFMHTGSALGPALGQCRWGTDRGNTSLCHIFWCATGGGPGSGCSCRNKGMGGHYCRNEGRNVWCCKNEPPRQSPLQKLGQGYRKS